MGAGRKRKGGGLIRWAVRGVALAGLVAAGFAGWLWWDMREWRPDPALYPEQGAFIASGQAQVNFTTLKAIGAQFVYLSLAETSGGEFASQYEAARRAGLRVGVVLAFDVCRPADPQSAYFAQMVPRESDLLPPAIALERTAESCAQPVSDAAVESELLILVNQVELHAGKSAIIRLAPGFAERYPAARQVERDLWLERDRARPHYAQRPWLLWSANSQLVSEASPQPLEWVVVQK